VSIQLQRDASIPKPSSATSMDPLAEDLMIWESQQSAHGFWLNRSVGCVAKKDDKTRNKARPLGKYRGMSKPTCFFEIVPCLIIIIISKYSKKRLAFECSSNAFTEFEPWSNAELNNEFGSVVNPDFGPNLVFGSERSVRTDVHELNGGNSTLKV
jgi:hypothetical protein